MTVYLPHTGPRHQYVFRLFAGWLGLPLQLVSHLPEPGTEAGLLIWYAVEPPPVQTPQAVWVKPHGLLEAAGYGKIDLPLGEWQGVPVLFPQPAGDWPFDVFAATFFLLTRYEEYWPHRRDAYDRYDYRQSLAARAGFLHLPLVNGWVFLLRRWLLVHRPEIVLPHPAPATHSHSFDLDIAFAWKGQPWTKPAWHLLKNGLLLRWKNAAAIVDVLSGKKQDPFDVFDWLETLQSPLPVKPRFYLLLSRRRHAYDKNVRLKSRVFRQLISRLHKGYPTGIHPGWDAGENKAAFQDELDAFQRLTGAKPAISRHHYLHFQLPQGYRQLIAAGIHNDASMGYGEVNGFRASIATPFRWYDLMREEETALTVHPFGFMDANALFEEKLSPEAGQSQLEAMMRQCEQWGVGMETVWHNHFLTRELHSGWREVYEWYCERLSDQE